ncbi:RNA polymerase sigma factor [Pelotomaculum propionicicum]|uniref:RNA polymerase sigma factor n=1 Tax=Pelotomaculum propionicicum TaxID=258475 RepID=UPI003B7F8E1D
MEKDELLVAMAQKGDLTAYEALVQRYQHKVFNLASKMVNNREDALDIAQEIFMQIYIALPGFRGESIFSTWVYRVASNKCLDFLRKRKAEKEKTAATIEENVQFGDSRDSPEELAIRREESRRVREALISLPRHYRIVIILHHYQQLRYKEIAEVLNQPVKTVATRLYRAKLILKKKLIGGESGELQSRESQPGKLPGQRILLI